LAIAFENKNNGIFLKTSVPMIIAIGEPLWLSGKVVKNEKINKNQEDPGLLPNPGQPL
jgi:hypothetical protein